MKGDPSAYSRQIPDELSGLGSATSLQPGSAAGETTRVLEQIRAAAARGDDSSIYEIADAALDRGLGHPLLFHARATQLWKQGLFFDALLNLESTLRYSPCNPVLLNEIGECMMKLGVWRSARRAFDGALNSAPELVHTHYRRGVALQMYGQREEARASHLRAIELQPAHAGALASLALIAAGEGKPDDVAHYGKCALAIDPSQPTAHIALATSELALGEADAAERRVRSILRESGFGEDPRANDALRAIGDAFHQLGRRAFAFEVFAEVNAKRREIHARRFAQFRSSLRVSALNTYFQTAPRWRSVPAAPPTADEPAVHVFVLGFARAGTTLVETVIASHDRVLALDERDCFPDAAKRCLRSAAGLERLSNLPEQDLTEMRKAYWQNVQAHGRSPAGKVFVDKWPFNSRRLPLIARLFPGARVIFALRDPRDIVLSCFRRSFVMNPDTFEFLNLTDCANFYAAVMNLAWSCRSKLPLEICEHRYEDMIADFDASVSALCRFVGIEWNADMRDFSRAADGTIDANAQSGFQVRKGLYSGAIGQWRAYKENLAPVLPILEPWVERLGYAAD